MKENVLSILKEVRPDIEFMKETALIDDGILDYFDIWLGDIFQEQKV